MQDVLAKFVLLGLFGEWIKKSDTSGNTCKLKIQYIEVSLGWDFLV